MRNDLLLAFRRATRHARLRSSALGLFRPPADIMAVYARKNAQVYDTTKRLYKAVVRDVSIIILVQIVSIILKGYDTESPILERYIKTIV